MRKATELRKRYCSIFIASAFHPNGTATRTFCSRAMRDIEFWKGRNRTNPSATLNACDLPVPKSMANPTASTLHYSWEHGKLIMLLFFVHSPMTASTLASCAGGNIVRAHSPLFVSISQWAYKHATTERCTGAGILRCCCSCWCGLQQWPVWIIQNGAPSFWGLFVGLVSPCSLSDFPSGGREGRELLGRWVV